ILQGTVSDIFQRYFFDEETIALSKNWVLIFGSYSIVIKVSHFGVKCYTRAIIATICKKIRTKDKQDYQTQSSFYQPNPDIICSWMF
ncbi:MAG: hypothetical protein NT157_00040, partial [Candidatus Micrarchaeota archaeon]|nr:hypothetical protein [Candidatus Micrarchaeota archaeon]